MGEEEEEEEEEDEDEEGDVFGLFKGDEEVEKVGVGSKSPASSSGSANSPRSLALY